ncbi:CLUMA_CG003150, isoform A [Clunio marinus]|uniref:CLUMA_CG003150, isoform A n=1 Tax=Clunio marinus TaxID=568069 RepID=A0A1J1HMW7_9DIPT|nr:CLUMA_CG003150, isoform A [Clunio marinus]
MQKDLRYVWEMASELHKRFEGGLYNRQSLVDNCNQHQSLIVIVVYETIKSQGKVAKWMDVETYTNKVKNINNKANEKKS